jgi:hypothetical protein
MEKIIRSIDWLRWLLVTVTAGLIISETIKAIKNL